MTIKKMKQKRWLILPLLSGCMVGLISCAGGTPPIDAISTADMAINRALDAKAAQLAPLDIRLARDKIALAKSSMNKQNYVHARRLAEQAQADAGVAEVRSRAQTASDSNRDVEETMELHQDDVEQKTTDY